MRLRNLRRWLRPTLRQWILAGLVLIVIGLAAAGLWSPQVRQMVAARLTSAAQQDDVEDHPGEGELAAESTDDDHEHDHAHEQAGDDHLHIDSAAIELSPQARGNIGLRTEQVALKSFERTITVPGIMVERPGWSQLHVTSPMTGVVTRVYPVQGEAVRPGQPLFDVRLTHEDLLQAQFDFLGTIEELDVIRREVERLSKVTAEGAIAGKALLERQYEQQKQEAHRRAQEQALLLHGLSEDQISEITATRKLVQSLTIRAPLPQNGIQSDAAEHVLQVRDLTAAQGKYVEAGDALCTLVDYAELYAEGQAFEQDVPTIHQMAAQGWDVSVIVGSQGEGYGESLSGLKILYMDDNVDVQSRTFRFYVPIPNKLLRSDEQTDGRRFIYWRFKPGQRIQVRVPVERWEQRIVLPVEAVVQEGAEAYVFEANGDHFDRRAVHVEYRDQDWVVIANDGALRIGATVATSAAHLVQLALKAKAGGGVDPHAGHNH